MTDFEYAIISGEISMLVNRAELAKRIRKYKHGADPYAALRYIASIFTTTEGLKIRCMYRQLYLKAKARYKEVGGSFHNLPKYAQDHSDEITLAYHMTLEEALQTQKYLKGLNNEHS